jgi:hypothetical protein
MTPDIPDFLSHLKTFNGYPVPFVQMWIDGKPDFRVIDPYRVDECAEQKLCAICGRKLGQYSGCYGYSRATDYAASCESHAVDVSDWRWAYNKYYGRARACVGHVCGLVRRSVLITRAALLTSRLSLLHFPFPKSHRSSTFR